LGREGKPGGSAAGTEWSSVPVLYTQDIPPEFGDQNQYQALFKGLLNYQAMGACKDDWRPTLAQSNYHDNHFNPPYPSVRYVAELVLRLVATHDDGYQVEDVEFVTAEPMDTWLTECLIDRMRGLYVATPGRPRAITPGQRFRLAWSVAVHKIVSDGPPIQPMGDPIVSR
jgi:hypothetical protein